MLFLAHKYAGDAAGGRGRTALCANAALAGDSCNRGMLLGVLLGAAFGRAAWDDPLVSTLHRYTQLVTPVAALSALGREVNAPAPVKDDARLADAADAAAAAAASRVWHVAGFESCPYFQKAVEAVRTAGLGPRLVVHQFATRPLYKGWLPSAPVLAPAPRVHTSCPFVFTTATPAGAYPLYVGGHDDLVARLATARSKL